MAPGAGTDLVALLPASRSVGTIRTRCPTLYVFPGGNEDAAFLTVNGFSVLLDGGDKAELPFWTLIRNYDKISAAIATRSSADCLRGIATILARKAQEECHPNIGAFIGNLPPRAAVASENDTSSIIRGIYDGLRAEGLKPTEAFSSSKAEPITLYEVIGEGALRMIVLNPERGSKEFSSLTTALKTGEDVEKHSVATSLAVLLVWHPCDSSKPTTRILYPGACPLDKLYAALERVKGEEYLRHVEFVSGDREKFASNLSLNARGGHANVTSRNPVNAKPVAATRTAGSAAHSKPAAPAHKSSGTTTASPAPRRPPVASVPKPTNAVEPVAKKVVKQPVGGSASSRLGGINKKPVPASTSPTKPAPKLPSAAKDAAGPRGATGKPATAVKKVPQKPAVDANAKKAGDGRNGKAAVVAPRDQKKDVEKPAVEPKSPPPAPQVPDSNGLLDSIEPPFQVRRISMDTTGDGTNAIHEFNNSMGSAEPEHHDGEQNTKDTPLLDSTPVETMASAPLVPELADQTHPEPVETEPKQASIAAPAITGQRSHIEELLAGDCPVTAGLASNIVNDATNESARHKEDPMGIPPPKDVSHPFPLDGDVGDALINGLGNIVAPTIVGTDSASASVGNNVPSPSSHDSVNAQPDSALDDVIESLAGESELEDIPKAITPSSDDVHVDEINKVNGGGFIAQHTVEDAHAQSQFMPPIGSTTRGTSGGAASKPKISQPLYFDVVFIPHHGARPALQDEAAAKAFAVSVRSKRYVMSGELAIKTHILDGIIAAKNMWNKPELEIDVVPAYSSEMLSLYSQQKGPEMCEAGVNLRCAVDRCTLRLCSGETDDMCSAFKFEM